MLTNKRSRLEAPGLSEQMIVHCLLCSTSLPGLLSGKFQVPRAFPVRSSSISALQRRSCRQPSNGRLGMTGAVLAGVDEPR
jgi:hypothetical protein